jgi:hypothetical protein
MIHFFSVLLNGEPWPANGPVRSDFLVAQPSFLSGVASLINVPGWCDVYNGSRNTDEADARAMRADWQVVGQDLRETMDGMGPVIAAESERAQQLKLPTLA